MSAQFVPGILHGHRCGLDFYVRIPDQFGRYEWINSILIYRGMPDGLHNRRRATLCEEARNMLTEGLSANEEVSIVVNGKWVVSDVAVGPTVEVEEGKVTYGDHSDVPRATGEITSPTNWTRDFEKIEIYANMGVAEYVIVHLVSCQKDSADYGIHVYRGTQRVSFCNKGSVDTEWFGKLYINDFVDPESPSIRRRSEKEELARLRRRYAEDEKHS